MRLALLAVVAACHRSAPPPPPPPTNHAPPSDASSPPRLATVEQCDRLLDHLADLEFEGRGDPGSKEQVRDAQRDQFRASCTKYTRAVVVECALAARDLVKVAECDNLP